MNDRWRTAVHEAGHAVVGRVLGMECGPVTIIADEESAGHSICADPWTTLYRWERRDRFREARSAYLGRIMTYMAGAEAEAALIGRCQGGDGDDRREISAMLESRHCGVADDRFDRTEARCDGQPRPSFFVTGIKSTYWQERSWNSDASIQTNRFARLPDWSLRALTARLGWPLRNPLMLMTNRSRDLSAASCAGFWLKRE